MRPKRQSIGLLVVKIVTQKADQETVNAKKNSFFKIKAESSS